MVPHALQHALHKLHGGLALGSHPENLGAKCASPEVGHGVVHVLWYVANCGFLWANMLKGSRIALGAARHGLAHIRPAWEAETQYLYHLEGIRHGSKLQASIYTLSSGGL